jgi:hypothetical protein
MPSPAKLEVVIKFSELPADITVDKNGWKHFSLDCSGVAVAVVMRPKNWNKIDTASKTWPAWVAALAGTLRVDGPNQLSLPEAQVQVFERKLKPVPVADAPADAPAGTTPSSDP